MRRPRNWLLTYADTWETSQVPCPADLGRGVVPGAVKTKTDGCARGCADRSYFPGLARSLPSESDRNASTSSDCRLSVDTCSNALPRALPAPRKNATTMRREWNRVVQRLKKQQPSSRNNARMVRDHYRPYVAALAADSSHREESVYAHLGLGIIEKELRERSEAEHCFDKAIGLLEGHGQG